MNNNIKYTLTNDSLTVVLENKVYNMVSGHPSFITARNAVLNGDIEILREAFNIGAMASVYTYGKIKIADGKLTFANYALNNGLIQKVLHFMARGEDYRPIVAFLDKIFKNPIASSRNEFCDFVDRHGITICDDGDVLLYKSVRAGTYKDWHTDTYINNPGAHFEKDELEVDQDRSIACSHGWHVGTLNYAKTFNSGENQALMVCKINPIHVRCVPEDCNYEKVRSLIYDVIGEYKQKLNPAKVYTPASLSKSVVNFYSKRDEFGRFTKEFGPVTKKTEPKRDKNGKFC